MKQLAISIIACLSVLSMSAQEHDLSHATIFSFSIGAPLNRVVEDSPAVHERSNPVCIKIDGTFLINKHFGCYVSADFNTGSKYTSYMECLIPDLHKDSNSDFVFANNEMRFSIGGVYNIQAGRFRIMPFLGIGYSHLDGKDATIPYKCQEGTNQILCYFRSGTPRWIPVIVPGCRVGLQLSKELGLFMNLDYSVRLRHASDYSISFTDMYTGEEIMKPVNIRFNSPLTLTVGFSFTIK